MSNVIVHQFVEQNLKHLKKNPGADCALCAMAEKTRLMYGGEGYLCHARLYDGKTLACFVPKTDSTTMTFGEAIEEAKKGNRIARKGWNGKNMSVAYQKGYPDGIPCNKNTAEAWGMQEGELFKCRPYLQMRCADGTFQMWLATQSDILADDWFVVE